MELRLLGSLGLDLDTGNGQESVPAGKSRSLLVLLALNPNESVSSDRIVDALWGETPPASATAIVQTYVSRLRKILGEGRIETVGHGYRLVLADGERDIDRVEMLQKRSGTEPPHEAAKSLHEAIRLFRGQPLADVAGEEFAQAELRRLEELRAALVVERIDADIQSGRHAQVVAELEGLVASRPLDERIRGLLILALYRSGRQADALAAYQDARRTLKDDLGLEPSDELRSLQRKILEHDPSLGVPESELSVESTGSRSITRSRLPVLAVAAGLIAVLAATGVAGALTLRGRGATAVPVTPNSVAVIDPERRRVVANVPVGRRPLFVTAGARWVWVAAVADRTLTQIDPRTFRVTATVGLGFEPTDIEAVGDSVWVAGGYEHALWRVDRDGVARIKRRFRERDGPLPVGFERGQAGLAASPEGLWLAHGDEVTLLDPVSGMPRANVKVGGTWVNEVDVGRTAFVANSAQDPGDANPGQHVESFDPQTLEVGGTVSTPTDASDILVASGYAWITLQRADQLWQVDEANLTLRRTIDIGDEPIALAFFDDAIWVVSQDEAVVRRVNPGSGGVEETIEVGHTLEGIAPANDLLWVAVREP